MSRARLELMLDEIRSIELEAANREQFGDRKSQIATIERKNIIDAGALERIDKIFENVRNRKRGTGKHRPWSQRIAQREAEMRRRA